MLPIVNPGEGGGSGSGPVTGGGSGELGYITGKNLREGNNITLRPKVLTSKHLYNLRNQSWAIPRPTFDGADNPFDVIGQFYSVAKVFPSNSDVTTTYTYENTSSNNSKFIRRFNANDCFNDPRNNAAAPIGYFIIDALDRGASRKAAYAQMMVQYPSNTVNISDLPQDESPYGATVVCEFSGRIFYGGFTGDLIGGDTSSPKLSSYVMFSQLVTDNQSIYNCYQAGDPTSNANSDLVDTDGGFIRVQGAYNICAMANIQTGLVVLAENGAWVIQGGNQAGFTATNYRVIKVSDVGCVAKNSVVVVNNAILYWGKDGIYNLTTNQFGDFVADNITRKSIQTFYNSIDIDDQTNACGVFDEYEQKVKWVYGNRYTSSPPTYELILDMLTGAFSKFTIARFDSSRFPMLVRGIQTNPFTLKTDDTNVIINDGSQVIDSINETVILSTSAQDASVNAREVQYLVILSATPTLTFTFANYTEPNHYDWKSLNGVGIDAASYLLTGVLAGGDYQRGKNIAYITTHFNKTEDGLTDDGTGSGDLTLTNQSSCIMQAQWQWTNSVNSNKWSKPQQAYRLNRYYFPTDASNFNDGHYVVETRSKLRGDGKVLSLLYQSEPNKHCEILGWSLIIGVNGNV